MLKMQGLKGVVYCIGLIHERSGFIVSFLSTCCFVSKMQISRLTDFQTKHKHKVYYVDV